MDDLKPKTDLARLIQAIGFAADKHRDQRRKDKDASPYINHPIAVVSLLAVEAGIEDIVVLQAAALHDTIEDTKTSYAELVEHFGREVADVVAEVTDDKSLPRDERKSLQLLNAPYKSERATLIKIADKTCNLRDITSAPPAGWSIERRREYSDWAKAVVEALPPAAPHLMQLFGAACRGVPAVFCAAGCRLN